jgi:hypothetical protein
MNKTAIAPIIGALILGFETVSGHHLDEAFKNEIIGAGANIVLCVGSVWGIIKNHK